MNIYKVKEYYQQLIEKENQKLSKVKKQIFIIAFLRLLVVLSGGAGCYFLWSNTELTVFTVLSTLVLFVVLLKYHHILFDKKNYSLTLIRLYENELKGLDYDFTPFDGAPENINEAHSFSYDLDLFGDRSFFQSINRTVTSFGKYLLARYLLQPLQAKEDIFKYQAAIQELTKKQNLGNHFKGVGNMFKQKDLNIHKFSHSFSHQNLLYGHTIWNILLYLVPVSYLILFVLFLLKIVPLAYFIPLWLITFTISTLASKSVHTILDVFEKKTDVLSSYSLLFQIIEKGHFESSLLQENQKKLLAGIRSSQAVRKLEKACSNLNMGMAYPIVLFFNPVFLWNVRYGVKIEKWLVTYREQVPEWFHALAEFDALNSLSTFAFNHPEYIYPTPKENHFVFRGEKLGHPLIHRDKCVKNDVMINKDSYFLVVTGANMAGKSTYLRTLGINHVLACTGAPVCADSLEFSPAGLVTNLRTTDSLADNESYFFSELKRLQMIINQLQAGEKLFIILDEILKGTNSEDKQKGSLALMKQLITLKGNGVIATHDLVLGTLEKEYPEHVKNYCFEADITNDKLTFSYRIKEGVAKNMNACFLMKKMGITGL